MEPGRTARKHLRSVTPPTRSPRPLEARTGTPDRVDTALADRLERALAAGGPALDRLVGAEAVDDHDRLVTLVRLHGLHVGPLESSGRAVRWQNHPALAELTWRLEAQLLAGLEPCVDASSPDPLGVLVDGPIERVDDPVAAMRAIATVDLVPEVYDWLASDATYPELVSFLALEGGPDAGFDDLVAACQIGLSGEPKLELARNYWDEMGRGELEGIHTILHDRLVCALDMPRVPAPDQPTSGLLRTVLGSLLVRTRALQPELVGALGLLELQAGPRCRQVVRALRRLEAPADALPFYEEHARVDPLHGKAWLDNAVRPLAQDAAWAARMVRGARWRSRVNAGFFADMHETFAGGRVLAAV